MNLRSAFLGLTTFTLLIASCTSGSETFVPKMGKITESVYASVTIEPDSMYNLHSVVSGIIADVYVEEGDIVTKNQPLVQITNSTSEINVENARLAYELAESNLQGDGSVLKSLHESIKTARLVRKQDSIDYMRQKRLWEQNIGSAKQFELKKLAYEVSAQNLEALLKEYKRTEAQLKTNARQAENNYKNAKIGKNDFTIYSRMSGRVYSMNKEAGELVNPQEPIATIGKETSFIIKLLVDEVDIIKVKIGQEVIVKLDAYEDRSFKARIQRILPQKNIRTQTFAVEASFETPPKNLYSGLSGEANIVISTKHNVLLIPRKALTENNEVKTSNGMVAVELGLSNMEFVEVLSGIDSTTMIYLP
ncbi:MAG: HlyD family efflux transporter periplasmic adaptor subunit [Fulvivirga sp.]